MDSSDDDDSCSDEDAASRKRRDQLTRRPSYHKILKEISGPDMSGEPERMRMRISRAVRTNQVTIKWIWMD